MRVSIQDEGPGVPPEVVPQLFQKFVRRGKSEGKAGLGLYFCRMTVEQWGGKIGCEPRDGGGTSFWFRLESLRRPPSSTAAGFSSLSLDDDGGAAIFRPLFHAESLPQNLRLPDE